MAIKSGKPPEKRLVHPWLRPLSSDPIRPMPALSWGPHIGIQGGGLIWIRRIGNISKRDRARPSLFGSLEKDVCDWYLHKLHRVPLYPLCAPHTFTMVSYTDLANNTHPKWWKDPGMRKGKLQALSILSSVDQH
jgi:hypothetical protein